ncbi:Myblike DNAbinding domain-containing protein [Linnemannia exigua]|uniref:Myblike DNAbinding domain-containing protein n=1 Tax=Linnemannia exigua TaxID=604196 RepID=A0AAD4DJZ6_9FUNG|nr:Myblike DNAbinding domain-containing protein [Linnemannia exigua]
MAWIGRVLGTGARATRGEKQCRRWSTYLHATTPTTEPSTRSMIPTHSTTSQAHRRWIHSTPKSQKQTSHATNSTTTTTTTTGPQQLIIPTKKPAHIMRNTYIWTPELDAIILDMRLEGGTWHEIGAAIGRDHAACHQRYLKELDPALHKQWNPERLEQLNAMVAEGKSWRHISDKMLITQSICREKWMSMNPELVLKAKEIKKLERPRPSRPPREPGSSTIESYRKSGMLSTSKYRWCDHLEALLLELKDRGLNWRQIGSVFGVVPMSCYMRYKHRLKPQLNSGWVPPKLSTSNMPYYLLPQRTRPLPPTHKMITTPATGLVHNTSTHSTTSASAGGEVTGFIPWLRAKNSFPKDSSMPTGLIGVLGDDHSYDVWDSESNNNSRIWTPEEDMVIVKGREQGASFKTIGEHLKVDPKLCYTRYHTTLGPDVKGKEWTPELIEKLRFYVEQGLSWSYIANDLGFHRVNCREKYREISRPTKQSSGSSETSSHQTDMPSSSMTNASDADSESRLSSQSDVEDHQDLEDRMRDMLEDDYDDDDDLSDYDDGQDESEEDGDDDGVDDDDDDDTILNLDGEEDNDEDDSMTVGNRSSRRTKQKTPPIHSPTVRSIWDEASYMRERQKHWTTTEETALIRHVIRQGTRNWDEIAETLEGKHSAEECRAYWKFLDMPWGSRREALFWQLWLESGSNFEEIARELTEESLKADNNDISGRSTATVYDAKDCEDLFAARTRQLLKNSGASKDGDGEGDGKLDEDQLQKEYVQIALAQSKPAPFKWSKEKSVTLQKIIRQRLKTRGVHINWINWKWVARHVGDGATAQRCNVHWRLLRKADMEKDLWTNENILLLEQGIREVGVTFNEENAISGEPSLAGFRAIQRFYLPAHDVESIQRKFFLLSDKATEVTVQEYMTIMEAVDEYGEHHWDKVVKRLRTLPSSSSSSQDSSTVSRATSSSFSSSFTGTGWTKAPCRRVWEASYKHHLLYTPWSSAEDLDLRESVEHLGESDWTLISRFFPGKTAWQCRLRWCQITDPLYQPSSSSSSPTIDLIQHSSTPQP